MNRWWNCSPAASVPESNSAVPFTRVVLVTVCATPSSDSHQYTVSPTDTVVMMFADASPQLTKMFLPTTTVPRIIEWYVHV